MMDPNKFFLPLEAASSSSTPYKEDMYYEMNNLNRGIAVILNHESFEVGNLSRRTGTNKDKANLELVFKKLGFEVWSYTDLSFDEILSVLAKAAALDHSDKDCFVLVVLTHGENGILFTKDKPYDPPVLWSPFTGDKCSSLVGKPKIFFIQACQGDRYDNGVMLEARTETDNSCASLRYMPAKLPKYADFLLAFSTCPGYFSQREPPLGTWFIQTLCEQLEEHAYEFDLLSILTLVSRKVAIDFEDTADNMYIKQMPFIITMLTHMIQFTRKTPAANREH